jgi:hypothetical protein
LFREGGEVGIHVLLELADGFRTEGVGDGLAFAGVGSTVAGVEDGLVDGDESVVVFAVSQIS